MLKEKVAFITGCSKGIGKSIAEKFAKNGAIVYANARNPDSLKSMSEQSFCKGKIFPIYFDVTDRDAVRDAFIQIKKEQGRLDFS